MFEKLFSKRGLSLDRLRVFLEVAEAGGIAKAVGTDTVRQSQYSRQLKELAEHYGVELFQRRGKSLKLTLRGIRLAQIIRASFASLQDFSSGCANEPIRFALGTGDSVIQWLLLPRIGKLQREFPKVSLRVANLRTRSIISGLQEMSLDFGIVRKNAIPSNLKWKPLRQIEYALYLPLTMIPKGKIPSLEWVFQHLPIAVQASDGEFYNRMLKVAEKLKVRLNAALECESFPHAMCALQSGDYAAILPQFAMEQYRDSERRYLEIQSSHFRLQRRQIGLAWNPRTLNLRESAEPFYKRLCELLQSESY